MRSWTVSSVWLDGGLGEAQSFQVHAHFLNQDNFYTYIHFFKSRQFFTGYYKKM